jgi:hypothetical protein
VRTSPMRCRVAPRRVFCMKRRLASQRTPRAPIETVAVDEHDLFVLDLRGAIGGLTAEGLHRGAPHALLLIPLGLDVDADQSQTVLIDPAVDATTNCPPRTFASSCSIPLAFCSSGVVPVSWVGSEDPVVVAWSRAALPQASSQPGNSCKRATVTGPGSP